MHIAYPSQNQIAEVFLSKEEIASLFYHDIFEYPLTMAELIKWTAGPKAESIKSSTGIKGIKSQNGYFYFFGRDGLVFKRLMRRRISARKLEIAKRGTRIISFIPSVCMVAVTGALA